MKQGDRVKVTVDCEQKGMTGVITGQERQSDSPVKLCIWNVAIPIDNGTVNFRFQEQHLELLPDEFLTGRRVKIVGDNCGEITGLTGVLTVKKATLKDGCDWLVHFPGKVEYLVHERKMELLPDFAVGDRVKIIPGPGYSSITHGGKWGVVRKVEDEEVTVRLDTGNCEWNRLNLKALPKGAIKLELGETYKDNLDRPWIVITRLDHYRGNVTWELAAVYGFAKATCDEYGLNFVDPCTDEIVRLMER